MLKRSFRQLSARFHAAATSAFVLTLIAVGICVSFAISSPAHAECRFSSTAYPNLTPLTIDPGGLELNGGAFIHHGNVMAAGRIDNLIFFHVGGEIIPEITHVVTAQLNAEKQFAVYTFSDRSAIRVNLKGVTTFPHSQQSVAGVLTNADGLGQRFYLLCY